MDTYFEINLSSSAETMLHGVLLQAEFARVQVDKIIETFANCPLPNMQEGDEMQTIGDTVGSFVL